VYKLLGLFETALGCFFLGVVKPVEARHGAHGQGAVPVLRLPHEAHLASACWLNRSSIVEPIVKGSLHCLGDVLEERVGHWLHGHWVEHNLLRLILEHLLGVSWVARKIKLRNNVLHLGRVELHLVLHRSVQRRHLALL
jgi:hypothetical protein